MNARTRDFMAARAVAYQQRADELITAYHTETRKQYPDHTLMTMLLTHAAHWQSLAHGAASVASQTKGGAS